MKGGGGRGWIDLKHNVQVDELNAMHVLVEVTIGKDGSCWMLTPVHHWAYNHWPVICKKNNKNI